jgi:hypothetical protein
MNSWTKERLDRLIADAVEENLNLEYKRAASLENNDPNKVEITRDVSAFANSAGGSLIYGIAEFADKPRRHRPERLDPVPRAVASKEWLEQIIQTIQPRIDGVVIHPVPIDEAADTVCYVVEVPKSHTAHQARDHVYYKRQNFNRPPMEDYEVRDVMGRRSHPRIQGSACIERVGKLHKGRLGVKLENLGRVLARDFMVDAEVPTEVDGGTIRFPNSPPPRVGPDGACWSVRLVMKLTTPPLFGGSSLLLSDEFEMDVGWLPIEGKRQPPSTVLRFTVYADEMDPVRACIPVSTIFGNWVELMPTLPGESQPMADKASPP